MGWSEAIQTLLMIVVPAAILSLIHGKPEEDDR